MLSFEAAVAAAVVVVPLMLIGAYIDLKYLRLPNWLTLAMLAAFLLITSWDVIFNADNTSMTFGDIGWRLLAGFVALVMGFGLFSLGVVGGGDVKLLAASVPFIAPIDADNALLIYCLCTFLGIFVVWLLDRTGIGPRTGWATWATRNARGRINFPWGIALAMTMIIYHGLRVWSGIGNA